MKGTNVATLLVDMIRRRQTNAPPGWRKMGETYWRSLIFHLNLLVIQSDTVEIKVNDEDLVIGR